jgi:hypothetical protein
MERATTTGSKQATYRPSHLRLKLRLLVLQYKTVPGTSTVPVLGTGTVVQCEIVPGTWYSPTLYRFALASYLYRAPYLVLCTVQPIRRTRGLQVATVNRAHLLYTPLKAPLFISIYFNTRDVKISLTILGRSLVSMQRYPLPKGSDLFISLASSPKLAIRTM